MLSWGVVSIWVLPSLIGHKKKGDFPYMRDKYKKPKGWKVALLYREERGVNQVGSAIPVDICHDCVLLPALLYNLCEKSGKMLTTL